MRTHPRLILVALLCWSALSGCEYLQPDVPKRVDTSAPPVAGPAPTKDDAPPVAAASDTLVPFTGATATSQSGGCSFPGFTAPATFKVYAAGAYAGRTLDYQIDDSGHQATRIDVAVRSKREPVVLMLGAYEPTVWNIGWGHGTRIAAVLVSGYHRQAIAGLPADVPVLNSTHENRGPCGYFYVAEDQLQRLNPLAARVFGRPVDMVHPARNGSVSIGDAHDTEPLVTSSRIGPDSFRNAAAPLAGEAGLREAVASGHLREARYSDIRAWKDAFDAIERENNRLPPVAGGTFDQGRDESASLHNAYVVLKPMRIPAGLHGAHAATFIVPKGVSRPTGSLGHSVIYDHNTMTCAGLACRMR